MATIHIFRTAETKYDAEPGFDNARDSGLSERGLEQCLEFSSHSPFLPFMQYVTHVVSSPLRSSIYSCRIAFDRIVSSKQIILLPELMDIGSLSPSFGSSAVALNAEFSTQIDQGALPSGWESTDPNSAYAYDAGKIKARTAAGREWLMDLAHTAGEGAHIVVMTHGKTAHFVADDFEGVEPPEYKADWDGDLSWRSYRFDFTAGKMIETLGSRTRRGVPAIHTLTEAENNQLRTVLERRIFHRMSLVQEYQASHVRAEDVEH
ncbi:hypothetical protein F4781DRAFT_415550 [Annulohypoxylon bovei var. microspora]|nr:hypothetical protein F4781DRAFT_415550 [Annulohypoxylon bovei var. microspora]